VSGRRPHPFSSFFQPSQHRGVRHEVRRTEAFLLALPYAALGWFYSAIAAASQMVGWQLRGLTWPKGSTGIHMPKFVTIVDTMFKVATKYSSQ
jgi:hypothetical protein